MNRARVTHLSALRQAILASTAAMARLSPLPETIDGARGVELVAPQAPGGGWG
jgi:hypothetical protein